MPDINCTMDKDAIKYAIAKQVHRMEYIHTAHGDLELDPELAETVREAIERILYKRIDMLNAAEITLKDNKPFEKTKQFSDQLNIARRWAEKQAKKS